MDIGKQIRALRTRRGVTQEAMAAQLGVSPQAVSKWERGAAAPDIGMLPALSVYLGVSIDELFSLSEDARMERIQNMLWDKRELTDTEAENARSFLLDKARREQSNGEPLALLADLENHVARGHRAAAAQPRPYWFLLDQLIDDGRLTEAERYIEVLEKIDKSYRPAVYRGLAALRAGRKEQAEAIFRQVRERWPDDWRAAFDMGDVLARTGEYEKAKAYYRASIQMQRLPRYTDGLTSISQICEIEGDLDGAIAAAEEEIAVLAGEWNTTAGESVDQHRRRIAYLREKKEN